MCSLSEKQPISQIQSFSEKLAVVSQEMGEATVANGLFNDSIYSVL